MWPSVIVRFSLSLILRWRLLVSWALPSSGAMPETGFRKQSVGPKTFSAMQIVFSLPFPPDLPRYDPQKFDNSFFLGGDIVDCP